MEALAVLNTILMLGILALQVRREIKSRKPLRQNFEDAAKMAASMLQESIEWLENERKQEQRPRPIRHDKVNGPRLAKLTSSLSYWVPKDEPTAEPFLAAHYEKDTTCPEAGDDRNPFAGPNPFAAGASVPDVIPADTFVDLLGRRIPGAKFRSAYVPAPEVEVVGKVTGRTRHSDIVGRKANPQITPEEEQQLAEEYEVVDNPPSLRREVEGAQKP